MDALVAVEILDRLDDDASCSYLLRSECQLGYKYFKPSAAKRHTL